jgi:hypothetical protein
MFKSLLNWFSHLRTEVLAGIPYLLGMIILLSMQPTAAKNINDPFQNLLFSTAMFLWGLSGIPIIIRREVHTGFFHLKGWPAMLSGLILTVTFFSAALMPFLPKIK